MSSESDDDMPLGMRTKAKGAATAPAAKQQGVSAKGPAVKSEVKEEEPKGAKGPAAKTEAKEEVAKGTKGPQGKDQQADAKGKGADKKPSAAKGKAADKDDDSAAVNGKAAPKKAKDEGKQPREKKEFDMPGQTREPPPETDALRKFYTSLLEQRPESEMAKKWCLMYGLLSRDVAEELVAQLKKSKPVAKSPAKPSGRSEGKSTATKARQPAEKGSTAKRKREAITPPKKARATYSDEEDEASSSQEDDDDFDDEPLHKGRPKPGSKPSAGKPAAPPPPKPRVTKDKAFSDGGLEGSDDDDDDVPVIQRLKKK